MHPYTPGCTCSQCTAERLRVREMDERRRIDEPAPAAGIAAHDYTGKPISVRGVLPAAEPAPEPVCVWRHQGFDKFTTGCEGSTGYGPVVQGALCTCCGKPVRIEPKEGGA